MTNLKYFVLDVGYFPDSSHLKNELKFIETQNETSIIANFSINKMADQDWDQVLNHIIDSEKNIIL
ncbi:MULTISPECIES: hypothetical protein [Candidatus Thioglobus]|jgi:hypothetical protein|uniref:Uncharacterized protein n=1 Tax=Candidatus Thioglobus autotrophicus TaxID=1705394 RepID=A0A0M4PLL3_9GAMM|nr:MULTISPECIES: hypothetical protein [Candidatus Thioglobus]ALE53087.1 hypothetical protein SP60_07735 [Candidatus Thioglobus autotrophicus]MBT3276514.1 hypothetical protein [Candidatus Thioglobus sp.]MBT7295003.1 hypothetical protein [Candidatus Thioglobus sp.]WPE17211.1 hypothetical protein R5P06_03870 [Candidatus Thioglobus autotrophicus]